MKREKLNISKDDALEFALGDNAEGFKLIEDKLVDTSRWSEIHEIVIQRNSDGKFFKDSYSVGATEQQDEQPWEYEDPDFTEVFKKEVTTFIYE